MVKPKTTSKSGLEGSQQEAERYQALVVDDESLVCSLVTHALTEVGFEVTDASNGLAALRLADRQSFDVVVTDIRMPEMNGLELLQALTERAPQTSVLLMSGTGDTTDRSAAASFGAFHFLEKPFSLSELQEAALRAAGARR